MRVGLLIYGSLDIVSGGYLYDRKVVEYFESKGDQVEVISLPWRNYFEALKDNLSQSFARRLKNLNVDILIQDELNHPSLFRLNHRLKPYLEYPLVSLVHHLRSVEHHPWGLLQIYREVERAYLNSIDGFIFVSKKTRESVQGLVGTGKPYVLANPTASHIGPGLSEEKIAARTSNKRGRLRLLFLGSVVPRKGLDFLVGALATLPQTDYNLTICGAMDAAPTYVKRIQKKVRRLGIEENLDWRGQVSQNELVHILAEHDVLALPSSAEGFGIAYLEGMAFGLPAIGTTSGAAEEVIEDGKNGYLVKYGDIINLANRIRKLSNDNKLLARMSVYAKHRYIQHPTWEDTALRIRAFVSGLI